MLKVFAALLSVAAASDIGATLGDGAISQLLRHAASKTLEEPRIVDVCFYVKISRILYIYLMYPNSTCFSCWWYHVKTLLCPH